MRKILWLVILLMSSSLLLHAQEQTDAYLQEVVKVVKQLRKGNDAVRNTAVATLSADKKPKMTLMDEIRWGGKEADKSAEVKGSKANRFKLNQVVARVYKNQNPVLETKSNMLNGNEIDIHYSAIEKSVKRGGQLVYVVKGRVGAQDFVFVPFNPKSQYVVTMYVGQQTIRKEAVDVCHIHLDAVSSRQPLYFSISYLEDKANKDAVESFAIINYNPRK